MKILGSEIKKTYASFLQHYIQYTILGIVTAVMIVLGVFFRYKGYGIGMYDRLMYFQLLYNLLLFRLVSNSMSLPFNEIIYEQDENKIIANISISKYNNWKVILSRITIKGIFSMFLSLLVFFALIIMSGVGFNYKNYLLLVWYYVLSVIFMYGVSFIFTGISNFFNLQKQVAIIFELALIVYFIVSPLDHIYNGLGYFKSQIHLVLNNDIVYARVTYITGLEILLGLLISIAFLSLGYILYDFLEYAKKRRGWKKYDKIKSGS